MKAKAAEDLLIPMACPRCETRFDWKLTPTEVRQWANALLAHADGMIALDGSRFGVMGGSDGRVG